MMRELSHRSKNLLTVVQAIARQIARRTQNFVDFEVAFAARLDSIAETHDLLIESEWRGADIALLVQKHLSPFRDLDEGWLTLDGPKLVLTPRAAEQIGFALHELGTNAAKHGALSVEPGRVSIQWKLKIEDRDQEYLHILWKESGGPVVAEVERTGFGKLVIAEIVPTSLRGKASLEFKPDGISWFLIIPTSGVLEKTPVTARRNEN
jgi:two-component sensor histidine kinase